MERDCCLHCVFLLPLITMYIQNLPLCRQFMRFRTMPVCGMSLLSIFTTTWGCGRHSPGVVVAAAPTWPLAWPSPPWQFSMPNIGHHWLRWILRHRVQGYWLTRSWPAFGRCKTLPLPCATRRKLFWSTPGTDSRLQHWLLLWSIMVSGNAVLNCLRTYLRKIIILSLLVLFLTQRLHGMMQGLLRKMYIFWNALRWNVNSPWAVSRVKCMRQKSRRSRRKGMTFSFSIKSCRMVVLTCC